LSDMFAIDQRCGGFEVRPMGSIRSGVISSEATE
jgi:hypothetical protein